MLPLFDAATTVVSRSSPAPVVAQYSTSQRPRAAVRGRSTADMTISEIGLEGTDRVRGAEDHLLFLRAT